MKREGCTKYDKNYLTGAVDVILSGIMCPKCKGDYTEYLNENMWHCARCGEFFEDKIKEDEERED